MAVDLQGLLDNARRVAGERVWGVAVQLARDGAVVGVSDDGDELCLKVKARDRALPHEVWLWPGDEDWGCDCELPGDACIHVCAAIISVQQNRTDGGGAMPKPQKRFRVQVLYAFTTKNDELSVTRRLQWPDGQTTALERPLKEMDVLPAVADVQAESLLVMLPPGSLSADSAGRLLALLGREPRATLDGRPVQLSDDPLLFRVRVTDDGEGFKAGLVRPKGVERWFKGAALVDGVLRPTSYGTLTPEQRKFLMQGVKFTAEEVARLVGDYLPRLRERIPVDVETDRLPDEKQLVPRIELLLGESVAGLEVTPRVVYGDPPVAIVGQDNRLKLLGGVVPGRDIAAERAACAAFEKRMNFAVGVRHVLPPARAAEFFSERLPMHDGPVRGDVDADRFQVVEEPVRPELAVRSLGERFHLDVTFAGRHGQAEPRAVLAAWKTGRTLVPLLDGGFAPLPLDWLEKHGAVLREILEARQADGTVDRHATAALVELLEDTEADVPPDLRRLEEFLRGEEGLPDVEPPDGFEGELRHYQTAGVRWLAFLRKVGLHGVLADDMGLGKTIQALAAMLETPGPHLVVAPTSVLRNWAREAEKFAPRLKVNLYHGPQRRLDEGDLVLTSYAIVRLDLDKLRARDWGYVILDEAQAIKNPRSQTARAAQKLPGRHRLALTGTPIENRLEELWSLFRFLMPGFLGSEEAFRERFAVPMEAGDRKAGDALRRRIRPYVLRRLKSQVAKELPALTNMVIRCEMGEEQRRVYEAVRQSAWRDVQQLLGDRGPQSATLQILEALLRMRQACCDPALLPGDHAAAGACKLDELEDLLVELVCEDHKALIFSQWTSLLDRVEARLRALGIAWVRLDGTTRDRQSVIDAFQSPGGPPVFLLSLKAGGTGLNLTAADYVVHLDPWWNPAVQQQATDRAHRIGQDKPVVSVKLIAEGTVEERILELQDAKRALADAALGTEGGFLRALNADELRSLFAP